MTTTRIVIETPCDCAEAYGREHRNLCNSPHRRTLTEGQYVLVQKDDGGWLLVAEFRDDRTEATR